MSKQSVKRTRDPEAKRSAILDAALAVFASQGFHATKTSEIARLAGVAEGSVFRAFESKEALANAVYLHCAALYDSFLAPPQATKLTPRKQFSQLFQSMARFYRDHPQAFIFYEHHSHRDYLDDTGRLSRAKHKAAIYELIRMWQRAGALRDESHEVLRALVIGGFARLVREANEAPFPLTDSLVQDLENVCWDAVRAR